MRKVFKITNIDIESPCIDCKNRHPACQDECEELKLYKLKIYKIKKELKEISKEYDEL